MSINGVFNKLRGRGFGGGNFKGSDFNERRFGWNSFSGNSGDSFKINKSPKGLVLSLGLVFMVSFGAAALFSHFNAPVKNSDAAIDPGSYSVSITSANDLNLSANANYEANVVSVKDTLVIKTNAPSGYRLYLSTGKIAGTNQASSLAKDNDFTSSGKFIKAIDSTISTPKALKRNTWGFALNSGTSGIVSNGFDSNYDNTTNSSKFAIVPAKNEELLIQQTNSANNEPGISLPIYFALRADMNMPSGNYRNTIVYTAIIEASNVGGGEATISPSTGLPAGGTNVVITTSLKLNTAPANLNEFLGVGGSGGGTGGSGGAGAPTVMIGDKACNNPAFSVADGTLKVSCQTQAGSAGSKNVVVNIPKLGKTYTINNGFAYVNPQTTFNSITTMQQMTQQICDNETKPHAFVGGGTSGTILSATTRTHTTDKNFIPEAELIDTRDNKKYVIRKLADGNCWMVQNLDLGNTGQSLTLTSSDTDIVSNFVLNNISNPGASWPTSTNQSNVNTVRVIDNGDKWLTNVSSGNNETVSTSEPSNPEEKLRHIGNYYNWYTATAGSGNYGMSSGNASRSICPKGWRLPFGEATTTNKSFQRLTDTYKITNGSSVNNDQAALYKLRSKPLSMPFSGDYWSTSVSNQGLGGYFWSSTASSQDYARFLHMYTNRVNPQRSNNKMGGYGVRCVAR